ncbi:MAG: hypothetical protein J6Q37_03220 [Bacteroidales bacterium]|nr:hypothetical protein [Bacteroidales bacterium]
MKMRTILAAAAVLCLAAGCIKEEQGIVDAPAGGENEIFADAPKIMAELSEPETRTCIEAAADATGKLPMLWEESDAVGVFFADGSSNAKYVNISGKNPNASFGAAEQVSGSEIAYVYYPYDAANNGKAATALSGNVPAEQAMDGSIHGDYKWGELKAQVEEGYKFKFHNMFSLVRFNINAEGTVLAGETLESVTLTVTRNGAAVPVTGEFTFDATDRSYELGTTSNELKTVWNQALSGTLSSFASVFPEIESGDQLTFVLETTNYKATLTVTSKANFASETYYTFPLTLSKLSGLTIVKKVSGTFKAATMNVDGLPEKVRFIINITINEGAPGSDGTKTISSYIANSQFDFVGCSEDFNYHSELASAMSGYTWGTPNNETIPSSVSSLSVHIDTDGLSFATRNETCSFSNEYIETFTTSAGGLTSGANTNVDKGFRHYVVTMKDGAEIDVIITHMNTYGNDERKDAQHAQLTQIATYINKISAANKRPIIFMGDTNCRYTRHDFQTYFWGKLNSNVTWTDPWVKFHRGGTYPTSGKSLMIRANYKGDTDNDIVCSDDQRGEVVDKIIYFNVEGASIMIDALESYNDVDNYTASTEEASYTNVVAEDAEGNILEDQDISYTRYIGYSDHFPVVAKFSYTGTIPMN